MKEPGEVVTHRGTVNENRRERRKYRRSHVIDEVL
jgi:hypothetical protein